MWYVIFGLSVYLLYSVHSVCHINMLYEIHVTVSENYCLECRERGNHTTMSLRFYLLISNNRYLCKSY